MDNRESTDLSDEREFAKPELLGRCQLITSPLNRDFSERVEAFQRTLGRSVVVVVTLDDGAFQRPNQLQAFTRISVVSNHIAEADVRFTSLIPSISENNFKRLKIGVNVAEYRNPHRAAKYESERDYSLRFCVWSSILRRENMPAKTNPPKITGLSQIL